MDVRSTDIRAGSMELLAGRAYANHLVALKEHTTISNISNDLSIND